MDIVSWGRSGHEKKEFLSFCNVNFRPYFKAAGLELV